MYSFLARIYRLEVDQDLLDKMVGMDLSTQIAVPEIGEGYRMLQQFLLYGIGETTLTDLAVDYARVFLGAGLGARQAAYPYESYYTSPLRLIMQDARDEVLGAYREEGLDRARDLKEPEDHVAFELEFMAYLSHKAATALKDGDTAAATASLRKQQVFLEQHLVRWVPTFCSDIERVARTSFYKAVAKITVGYLTLEQGLLRNLLAGAQEPTA
jgi:TorA maturation chaperone TorD